jgi:GNAT superfamily N-acetyltransferase
VLAKIAPHHRAKLASLLADTPELTAAEVAVALELVDAALATPASPDYRFILCEEGDHLLGYACFGPTPMTEACFDLYWLVVSSGERKKGIGRLLVAEVEREIARASGRMIRVETSSLPSYRPAHALYERTGYALVSRLRDFYAMGNDLCVFLKYLEPHGSPPSG